MEVEMIRPVKAPSTMLRPLVAMEVDMLVEQDAQLMKIAAAAALFVSQLQGADLPQNAMNTASTLAKLICDIPDDTMCDALDMLHA